MRGSSSGFVDVHERQRALTAQWDGRWPAQQTLWVDPEGEAEGRAGPAAMAGCQYCAWSADGALLGASSDSLHALAVWRVPAAGLEAEGGAGRLQPLFRLLHHQRAVLPLCFLPHFGPARVPLLSSPPSLHALWGPPLSAPLPFVLLQPRRLLPFLQPPQPPPHLRSARARRCAGDGPLLLPCLGRGVGPSVPFGRGGGAAAACGGGGSTGRAGRAGAALPRMGRRHGGTASERPASAAAAPD